MTHNFVTAGTYTVRIRGAFPRIFFNNGGDRQKLLNVNQWGTGAWTSMLSAFWGCSNLNITATDVPNLSGVTSTANMFASCTSLNGPANIGTWNTATVTDMRSMFHTASAFNHYYLAQSKMIRLPYAHSEALHVGLQGFFVGFTEGGFVLFV